MLTREQKQSIDESKTRPPLRPIISRLRRWLFPASPWVALLGVDGSGKSTVLDQLEQAAASMGYTGLFVLHRRPGLLYRTATDSHSGKIAHYGKAPHGALLSGIKVAAIWLDWLLGYIFLIRGRRTKQVLVIADRHALLDMLVDPLRYRYGGSPRWVRAALRCLPMPDGVILLDAPTAVLQARKQELTEEKTRELRQQYLGLSQTIPRAYVVDASQSLGQVISDVRQLVFKIEKSLE